MASFWALIALPERLLTIFQTLICSLLLLLALLGFTGAAMAAPPARPQQLTSPDQVPEGLAKSDWASIRAAYEAGRHAFQPTPTGWQARNPGQQWTTTFDRRGFVATPKTGGWTWGLELQGYGFGAHQQTIAGTPAVQAEGSRLTYQWDTAVQEWFVNDQRGLEHGFTVSTRPAADAAALTALGAQPTALSFLLAVRGALRPHVTPDALGVEFRDATGATVLNYAGLKVWDADGKILTSHFELADSSPTALGEQHAVRLLVDERDARYPITIDPIAQQAYLKASNNGGSSSDRFGYSVAVSGETVVVGAFLEDSGTTGVNSTPDESAPNAGAAYVFVRSGTTWSQQAYLKASQVTAGDNFGISVAVSGDTVVVGAYLEDSSTTGVNSTPDESVSGAGAAYVFVRSGTTWTQQAYLKASQVTATDTFGISVAVSGDTVVVGAYLEDSSTTGVDSTPNESALDAGAAYVFVRSGTTWSQQAYLKASQVTAADQFGISVAVSGDTVVVGARNEDSSTTGVASTPTESASNAGAAYVFVRSGTAWSQQAYLKASQVTASDRFGWSVAVSGDTVVVGAYGEDSSTTGVNSTPDESAADAGAAYVFVRSGTTWSQQAYLKASQVTAGDLFGYSVAVSGDTVVVGAIQEASSTTGVNSTPNELASNAGAAYVFTGLGVATVTTPTSASIAATSATLGGNVTSDGGATITATGIVYAPTATNTNPQIGGTGVTDLAGLATTGVFTVSASSLTAGTAYTYTAYATTSAGTVYSNTGIFTTAATSPGAPTSVSAALGNTQVTVSFTAPASDGGAAITSYTVTSTPGSLTATGASSPITITGLTNGTSYTFTVTATNSAGTGSASSASSAVTPATSPGAPTSVAAVRGPGEAVVSFTAPVSNGGAAITSYRVTASPGGVTATAASSPITITGLTNGTSYTFTVTATNSVATGSASTASSAITPAAASMAGVSYGSAGGAVELRSTAVDAAGNIYLAGHFSRQTTLELGTVTLNRIGSQDAWVAKLDSNRTVVWAKNYGGSGAVAYGFGIAVDGSGNVYFGGYFDTANLTTPALPKIGTSDAFALKLDSSGAVVWAKNFGGSGAGAYCNGIAVDGSGNVYLGGYLDRANLTTPALTKIGTYDAFALKLDSSGATTWAKNYGGSGADAFGIGIAVDGSGNVYLGGHFEWANLTTPALTKIGTLDAFALKLDSSGATTWVKNYGGSSGRASAYVRGIAVDGSGNVYLGGYFESANLTTPALTKIGTSDAFALKLDSSGATTWAKNYGGSGARAYGRGIAVDGSGNVYLGGYFDRANLTTPALTRIGTADAFALKLDSSGTTTWAKNYGGSGASANRNGIAVDRSGYVYLGGYFSGASLTTPALTLPSSSTSTYLIAAYLPEPTAPGSPTSVSAVAANTQVTVSFSAPASDGGAAITGYTVTSIPFLLSHHILLK